MQNQWLQHFSADGLQPQLLSADQDYLPPMITDGSSHLLNGYWEDPNNLHGFDDSELAETSSPQNPNTSLAATGTDNMDLNSNLTNSSTFFSPNMDCYATNAENQRSRSRFTFSPQHLHYLEMKFQENRYPDKDARSDMAAYVGCGENSVYTWFNRRRSKDKDDAAKDTIDPSVIMQGSRDGTPMELDQSDDYAMDDTGIAELEDSQNIQSIELREPSYSLPSLNSPLLPPPQPQIQQQVVSQQQHHNENPDELSTLVGPTGGIPSPTSLRHLVQMMRNETRLVRRSVMLTMIMRTNDISMLKSFVNSKGLVILRAWLAETAKSDNAALLVKLLETLKHLPIDLEALRSTGLGKVVKTMIKNSDKPEIKQLTDELMQQWKQLIERVAETTTVDGTKRTREQSDSSSDGDIETSTAPRKRLRYFMNTIEIPLLRKAVSRLESVDRPAKKTSTVPNIQREVPKTKAVTDTGFFDTLLATSQTKTSMPSKSAVSNQISIGSNNRIPKLGYTLKPPTSQPKKTPMLSIDSILETWNASKTSTAIDQSQLGAQSGGDTTSNTLITNSEDVVSTKKRKKVTWASGDELEKIKIFESDPDELGSEMYGLGTPHEFGNARDMDINEAKAAFHSDMQATMDWYPPAAIWFPDNFPVLDVIISEETKTQTLREQVALAAVYFTETHIPSSPAEPDEIPNDNLLNVRVIPLTDESEAPYITPIPTLVMPTSSGILSLSNTGIVNDALGSSGTLPTIVSTSIAQQVPVSTASVDLSLLASMSATQLASILGARTTPTATDVTSSVSGVTPNHTIPVSHLTSVGNSPQVAGSNMYQGASTNPPEQPQPQPQLVHQLLQSPALMHEFLAQLGQLQTPPQATAPQHSRQQDYHMQQPLQHDYRPSSTQDYRTEEIYSDDYDGYDAEPSSRSGRLTPQDRERDRAYGFGRGRGNAMNTPCRFYAMGRCLKGSHCAFKH